MKKRLFSLLVAFCAAALLLLPAARAAFPDVDNPETARAAEVLRLMGVMEGYADGTFRPETALTRAQFCKMVISAIGAEKNLGLYASSAVFPDVRTSHWAAPYINLAAKEKKIISGYADGTFRPDGTVTLGHAAAILLRLLGYKDAEIGGIWPDGFLDMAESIGLLDGVGADRGALTRARAARLFVNFLRAETTEGAPYYTLSDETALLSLDGGAGTMTTTDKTYDMEKPQGVSSLTGSRGQVVLRSGKALTFLPAGTGGGTGNAVSSGALIVSASGSTAGFSALTGGRTDYSIYKNGLPASAADLRAGDVASYAPGNNAVLICDTRVTAYYESCDPSPTAPSTIEILETAFPVLSTAADSLARFRPGDVATFFLTADGRIAGAADGSSGNAAAVTIGGKVRLLCGGTELALHCAAGNYRAARISSAQDGKIYYSPLFGGASGDLDVEARTLGDTPFAANVRVYSADGPLALEELERKRIPASEISASRTNWAGDVDFIMIDGNPDGTIYFGRAAVYRDGGNGVTTSGGESWIGTAGFGTLKVLRADGTAIGPLDNDRANISDGAYVAVRLNRAGDAYAMIRPLERLGTVSNAAWIGKTAVTYGGRSYSVAEGAACYNRDNGRWITLDQALRYSDRTTLYLYNDAIRIVEVGN